MERKKRKGRRYTSSCFDIRLRIGEREKKERCLNVLEEIIAVTF